MGAKNYCKDKRDQEMRDYHFQYHAIQPANGKPYYIGGKKGKGRREVILKESLTIRNTYVIYWKMSQNFQVVRLVRVIAIMMMNVDNQAEDVEIPVWMFLICQQKPEYVRNYQNVISVNGMMVKFKKFSYFVRISHFPIHVTKSKKSNWLLFFFQIYPVVQ